MRLILAAALSAFVAFAARATTDGGVVVVKGQRFLAEVARTDNERARGLMYRTNLAKDRCMFFFYEEDGQRPIWMKNCLIALDVVWVKADGTVVEIKENVPPPPAMRRGSDAELPNYGGNVDSRHFIEFPVGTVRRLKLKVGDKVGWDLQFADGAKAAGGLKVPADRQPKSKRKR
ncbi:MAG: DUF192 domain-containing protein [Firmicutes bacterium]|nr:DUF192 domain-containing protein [Bacillota bacterium]